MSNKKLNKVVFAKQMETLNAFYVNLKVDLDNPLVVKVWYRVFENLDDVTFEQLVNSYCVNNIYPPQSPTHLIQHMKDMALQGEMSGEEAWEIGYDMVKRCGFNMRNAIDRLEKDNKKVIADTLSEIRSSFIGLETSAIPFVRKNFIEVYKINVSRSVNQKVMIGDTSILKIGG